MIDESLAKADELHAACEAFRQQHYPRRGEVFVGLYAVIVTSKTRRRSDTVLDLFGEYVR